MNLIKELENLGLTDKEAKVYLANLELGQESVQNIGKKAGVNRATTYVILNSLIKKGLCSTFEQGKKTFFVAANPELLESLLEVQKKEIEQKQKYFKGLIPHLELINNKQSDKPVVKFYEGKQGLVNCFMEFVSKDSNVKDDYSRVVFSLDKLDKLFTEEDQKKFKDVRIKNQAKSKSLYNSSGRELKDTIDGLRIKVSEKQFPLPCDIGIFGDKVRIMSQDKKLSGIIITDKDVATTMRSLFDLAWEAAAARAKKDK